MTEPADWQVSCKDIKSRMVTLYQSDSWTDCVFLFGSDKLVTAHKVVLAAASPVFATMFFGGLPESGAPIRVEDIQPDTFVSMLKYIYTDVTDIGSYNDALALYYAANKYMLLHLKTKCSDFLVKNLTATNCCLAYEFAQVFDEIRLSDACKEVMRTKTIEVLASSSFLAASLNTIECIYSMDDLAITSELDLFEALEHYAARKKNIEETGPNSVSLNNQIVETRKKDNDIVDKKREKTENMNVFPKAKNEETNDRTIEDLKANEVTMRNGIKLIRFLTMSAEEFARVPAVSPLLTQQEIISLLININHGNSNVPLPEGFSTKKQKRYKGKATSGTFKFTYIEKSCNCLRSNESIYFHKLYTANISWQVELRFRSALCEVYLNYSEKIELVTCCLKIGLVTKKSTDIHEFKVTLPNHNKDRVCSMGPLGVWNDIKSKYMDDGAITFEVELVIV